MYNLALLQPAPVMIRPLTEIVAACVRTAGALLHGAGTPTGVAPRLRPNTSGQCPRLTASAQWARVVAVIEDAVDHGRRAAEFHAAAICRLDASEYELRRLREELGAVLQRPAGILTVVSTRPASKEQRRPVALAA